MKKIKLIGVPGVDERLDLLGLFFFFFGAPVVTCGEKKGKNRNNEGTDIVL